MKPVVIKLIKLLFESQICTAAMLASKLEISVRSVKNHIYDINARFPDSISSSHKGYKINKIKALEILNDFLPPIIPQTSDERVIYIINKLIGQRKNDLIDIYDLADEIFVSISTLKNELINVRERLVEFDLDLYTKGDYIDVHGLERNKRKMLSSILYDESGVDFVNLELLQKVFLDIDIQYIKSTILEVFAERRYFINDYALINLLLHITLAIDRIRHDNVNNENIAVFPAIKHHEYKMAAKISSRLEERFNIKYSDAEIYELSLLLISRATSIDYANLDSTNLESVIGEECMNLVTDLIQHIDATYSIDLSEQQFVIRFALHIRNLLIRSKNGYFSKNPLTENIKSSYPLIYDMAISLTEHLKKKTGIFINDDEVAYIAIHLGSTLSQQKNVSSKLRVVLYSPNYYDINLSITNTINQYFDDDLVFTGVLTDESELDKAKDVDLIITTIPVSRVKLTEIIQINLFFSEKDRITLSAKIEKIKKLKQRKNFEKYLRELIIPDLFEIKQGALSKDECIDHMVKKLETLNYVNPSFLDEVIEREKLSSTAFGGFAIPHAMKMNAIKTGINVVISTTPIRWQQHSVSLVLMMCFNKNERHIFNEIYELIAVTLSESDHVKKISMSRSYDEFISNMVSLL